MKFTVMTLFPELTDAIANVSILGRALENECFSFSSVNIRDYSDDHKHRKVDDYTYGGGAGMLMRAQPVYDCYRAVTGQENHLVPVGQRDHKVIHVTPKGIPFTQAHAQELAKESHLVFLCGHYEGIDERALEEIQPLEYSVGDFVVTGGELPAMLMIDAIARLLPGVLNNTESAMEESFSDHLLEYPQYTRPEIWNGRKVPEILLSGDHAKVADWRTNRAIAVTKERRPDLYERYLAKQSEG